MKRSTKVFRRRKREKRLMVRDLTERNIGLGMSEEEAKSKAERDWLSGKNK